MSSQQYARHVAGALPTQPRPAPQSSDEVHGSPARASELVALDETLDEWGRMDPRKAQVVELRYFGGLTVDEIAEVLKVSPQTVMRDWKLAKVWMTRELSRKA